MMMMMIYLISESRYSSQGKGIRAEYKSLDSDGMETMDYGIWTMRLRAGCSYDRGTGH